METLSPGPSDYERALAAAGLGGIPVFHRLSTGSTNDDARALAQSASPLIESDAAIVVAETQTRGRGRGQNVWLSPRGSIALTITAAGVSVSRLGVLPLGVGSAVVGALRRVGASAFVKWPNDVLIEGRKVGGILCESSVLAKTARVFIGIGINVEAAALDPALGSAATTLAAHSIAADRPALVADVTARVLDLIRGEAPGEAIVQAWKAVAVPWWGEAVTVVEGGAERRAVLLDVNPEGQLVVRDESGGIRCFLSGDVRRVRADRG